MAMKSLCTIEGCGKRAVGHGWCDKHYRRWQRNGDPLGGGPERQKGRLCTVEGCERKHSAFGLCSLHYERLRYGRSFNQPVRSAALAGAGLEFVKDVALHWQSNECLCWPYGLFDTGYGTVRYEGKNKGAHVLVCELAHGPQPTSGFEVAHDCGNRSCVNPHHLRWATHTDNMSDKLVHGTHNRGERHSMAKLSEDKVREIRRLAQNEPQRDIAARFGVTQAAISLIARRQSWAWLE